MGYTTKIPDGELQRGDPVIDGAAFDEAETVTVTKAKVVTAEEDKPPVSTTASTKDIKSK
jgi:hypothetical protein